MVQAAVEAVNLRKRFGDLVAVDGVTFRIREGELFGLLGHNGAGKTTTIRMLTGLIKPDDGEAFISGMNVLDNPVKVREVIGVVPEEANPYPDLTVKDNLRLVGMLHGLPGKVLRERVKHLITLLDLKTHEGKRAGALSKGLRQRLLIAMALINKPKVLFLDEPTSGLDVMSARKVRGLIRELTSEGVTVLLTTHNVEEAGAICDRVAIMRNGRILVVGTPDDLRIKVGENAVLELTVDKPVDLRVAEEVLAPHEFGVEGRRIFVMLEDPQAILEGVAKYCEVTGSRVVKVRTQEPSFEDVFVRIVRR